MTGTGNLVIYSGLEKFWFLENLPLTLRTQYDLYLQSKNLSLYKSCGLYIPSPEGNFSLQ